MLTFTGKGYAATCGGATRRDFLQVGALGALGFSLPHLMAARAAGAVKPGHDDRSCIMIFNLGAPSNMDLWDMKPDAPAEIRGPFKPIQTAVPGFQLSEILPRHAAIADKMVRRGEWTKRIPNRFGAIAGLTGGKLGILGLGAIGMEIAKRAKGFDLEIGYCNRNKRTDVDFPYFANVMELAAWCDYLIVALRSDASNRHIISTDVLKALGPRGHVVNISRGWAVDEAAVTHALRNNIIEGAALDVYDEEPYTGTELLELDNLVMTPHFGGGTEHAQRRMTELVCRNLDAHFAGKPVVSPVPELRDMVGIVKPRTA